MMNASVITLKASSHFKNVAKNGTRWVTSAFIVQVLRKEETLPLYIGFTASRRVGGAVQRNRAKRRLREMARLFVKENPDLSGLDIVFIAKVEAMEYPFEKMYKDLKWALRRLEVLTDGKNR